MHYCDIDVQLVALIKLTVTVRHVNRVYTISEVIRGVATMVSRLPGNPPKELADKNGQGS